MRPFFISYNPNKSPYLEKIKKDTRQSSQDNRLDQSQLFTPMKPIDKLKSATKSFDDQMQETVKALYTEMNLIDGKMISSQNAFIEEELAITDYKKYNFSKSEKNLLYVVLKNPQLIYIYNARERKELFIKLIYHDDSIITHISHYEIMSKLLNEYYNKPIKYLYTDKLVDPLKLNLKTGYMFHFGENYNIKIDKFGSYSGALDANGLRSGFGKQSYFSGDQYVATYVGQFMNDKPQGKGHYTTVNGNKFVGDFKNGIPDGKGKYIFYDGRVYIGSFWNTIQIGHGLRYWPDGDIYIGEFDKDKLDGYGILKLSNGEIYIGKFIEGKRNGVGLYKWLDGSFYIGDFKNDLRTGLGMLYFLSGDDNEKSYHLYVGGFLDSDFNGYGVYYFPNVCVYLGNFAKSKREGNGLFLWADGSIYIGKLKDDDFYGDVIVVWNGVIKNVNSNDDSQSENKDITKPADDKS